MSRSLCTFLLALSCATQLDLAAAQGSATGQLLYVDREFTFEGGFTGVEPERPVPNAIVRIFDAGDGAILGTGLTDLEGNFAVGLTGSGSRDVIVRGFCISGPYGTERVRVEDVDGNVYSTSSPTISIPDLATPFDVGQLIAPIVAGPNYVGGPFNLFDQGVRAMEYVTAQGAGDLPEPLVVQWPDLFSFAVFNVAHLAADDGFDDIVALHEIGHAIHKLYSDSDSAGGGHFLGESNQDPSISLGEGWATFFAGAVRQHQGLPNPGYYQDCWGFGGTGPETIQLHMRFEDGAPFADLTGGEADEGAVFCALWDLIDRNDTDDGFPGDDDLLDGTIELTPGLDADQVQWLAFTGPEAAGSPYLHVIELWNGLFLDAGANRYPEMSAAFAAWKIRVEEDLFEPNDSTAQGTPLALGEAWSPTLTLYRSDLDPPVPGEGDVDVFLVDLSAGQLIEVETRYPGAAADHETYCDTRIAVFAPDDSLVASSLDGGAGNNAKLSNLAITQTGTHAVHVAAESSSRPTGSYELRALVLGAPAITNVSPSSVQTLFSTASPPIIVEGAFIGNATSVAIGGAEVDSFTPLALGQLSIDAADYVQLGTQDLVVTTPLGSASHPVTVTAPTEPVLNVEDGEEFWFNSDSIDVRVATQPGDLAFLFVSLSDLPTAVPGVLDLQIGGGLAGLAQLALLVGDGAGLASYEVPLAPLPIQVTFHLQAGVLPIDTLALPLVPTNTAMGKKLF